MLINKTSSCLLIIDVQERLISAMDSPRNVIDGCSRLLKGAKILNVPVIITEQYPKGLGNSIFEIKDSAPDKAVFFHKTSLSALREDGFMEKMTSTGKKQIIIGGIEEHVCVLQTAVDLKEKGFDVFVVTDACDSRTRQNKTGAEIRLRQEGIFLVTTEMVLFEWLEKAGSPEFKEIQNRLIR